MSNAFKLKNGSILLSTEAPGGIYNASQLKAIASLCDNDSVMVKATEDQRLALLVNPEKASQIAESLQAIGLGIRHYQDGLHQPVSCIGEMCSDFEQDALGSAMDISSELDGIKLKTPLKIGLNGCAKCCVPCHTLDVSVIGDSHGYRISLGGKNSQLPEMASFMAEGVPAEELPRLVKGIVEIYQSEAQESETLQELIDRDGAGKFIQALAPWSQDAAGATAPLGESQSDSEPVATTATDSSVTSLGDKDTYVSVTDESTIDHDLLVGDEAALVMSDEDDSDLNQEKFELNLSATSDSAPVEPLGEIAVMPDDSTAVGNVPIQSPTDDIPEIAMQEAELDELNDSSITIDDPATQNDAFQTAELESVAAEDLFEPETFAVDTSDVADGPTPVAVAPMESSDNSISPTIAETEQAAISESVSESESVAEASIVAGIQEQKDVLSQIESAHPDELENAREHSSELLADSDDRLESDSDLQAVSSDSPHASVDDAITVASKNFEMGLDTSTDIHDIDHSVPEPEMIDDDNIEDMDHDESDFDVHDHLPLSEVVATRKIVPGRYEKKSSSWIIAGIDFDHAGLPVISWNNGVSITITHDAIANGHISLGGHELTITPKDRGIQVELDGLKLYLPMAA